MDPKLEQAVQAIKSGDKSAGLVLLAQVIRADPNNESAWIWMATAQDDPEKKKQSLERVLRINPANERVRRALSTMFPPPVQTAVVPPAIETAPVPPVEEQAAAAEQPVIMEPPAVPSEPAAEVIPPQPEAVAPAPPVEAAQVPTQEAEAAPLETPPAVTEPAHVEVAGPDLSWLKETTFAPEETKEEAADLSWLKEDLPTEAPVAEVGEKGVETAQAESTEEAWLKEEQPPAEPEPIKEEPAPDLTWLKESQPAEEEEPGFTWPTEAEAGIDTSGLSWLKEEPSAAGAGASETAIPPSPTGETNDLAWLRVATAGPASEPVSAETPASEAKPADEEPDFSWLASEPATEEKPAVEPSGEAAFPWLEETPPAEGAAVKNEAEAIPDWLRQGSAAEAESAAPTQLEAELSAPEPAAQEPPTLESERLSPEDYEAITSKPAKLPFTWDEVTGEPVLKPGSETPGETFAAQPGEETAQAHEEGSNMAAETPAAQQEVAMPAMPAVSAPVSRPRSAAAAAAPSPKKGMSTGQIVLLTLLGVATLIVLLAFGFYLAVNFGWLKGFGF